jgi:hypothetical protein
MRFDMKNILIIAAFAGIMTGCKSTQVSTSSDDVYANPAEEKRLAKIAAEEKAKRELQEKQQRDEQLASEKSRQTESKPEKEPEYNSEDYYDYEYAARLNRFYNPIYGAGYYDPYYTNLYTYNQNPAFYGTSIYSSSLWMPSGQFAYSSFGISTGWGYGYSGFYNPYYPWYTPYGYSPWVYDPWGYNSPFYQGYQMGYYNGWNNSYYGYYNKYDPNSGYGRMEYGPRGSSIGSNSGSRASGMERPSGSSRDNYNRIIAEEQEKMPRFSSTDRRSNRINNREERPTVSPTNENTTPGRINRRDGRDMSPANPNTNDNSNRSVRRKESAEPQQPQQNQQQERSRWEPATSPSPVESPGSRPRNSGGGGNSRPR